MSIETGQPIPSATVNRMRDERVEPVDTAELFAGRKMVLFGVPGAFTPTCSEEHLPGYVKLLPAFRERGVDVACVSVNDAFVMDAWAKMLHVPPEIFMLADGNGDFVRALGLEMDGTDFGMGLRARRFALYAEDGIARQVHVEAPGEFSVSSAEAMLNAIA